MPTRVLTSCIQEGILVLSPNPYSVHIDRIQLTNFRCFVKESVSFPKDFVLLLGDNGSGKTALIEAVRIALAAVLTGLGLPRTPGLLPEDARERILPDDLGSVVSPPQVVPYQPVAIQTEATTPDGITLTWERRKRTRESSMSRGLGRLKSYAGGIASARSLLDTSVVMPLLAYYPANRGGKARQDKAGRTDPKSGPNHWSLAYEDSLEARLDPLTPIRWVSTTTYAELQQGASSPHLRAALDAVRDCLEGVRRVYFSVQLDELVAVDEFGRQRRAQVLSEGYWIMLRLVLDMAYRCAILNPHLGEAMLRETPGVVLIDELDQHLHPRWQQRVVDDLRRTFPQIQFIATTHSPLIGASLPSRCVYHLEADEDGWCHVRQYQERTEGLSPDQILSSPYFDLDGDRPVQTQDELGELSQRILDGDEDAALEYLRILNYGTERAAAGSTTRTP